LINCHKVVLPSPESFFAAATVTVNGFGLPDSASKRSVHNWLTTFSAYSRNRARSMTNEYQNARFPDLPLMKKLEIWRGYSRGWRFSLLTVLPGGLRRFLNSGRSAMALICLPLALYPRCAK
jgi:hypothetical protein